MNYAQKEKLYDAAIYGGGGLALTAILADLIRSHRRKAEAEESKQDNSLNLYVPPARGQKSASFNDPSLWKEAGLTPLLLASMLAGGTFYGMNSLYKKYRKGELEKELEQASGHYLDELQNSMLAPGSQKVAAAIPETASDIAKSVLLLSFLAGGAGTYGILENTFPKVNEKPRPGAPRKIVIKNFGTVFSDGKADGPLAEQDEKRITPKAEGKPKEEDPGEPEEGKIVSMNYGQKDKQKAAAYTALICAGRDMESSPLASLLGRILMDKSASGLIRDLHDLDFLGAISASKGCHEAYAAASDSVKLASAMSLFGSKELAPSAAVLLLGEVYDFNPEVSMLAKVAADDFSTQVLCTKFASTLLQQGAPGLDKKEIQGSVDDADPWLSDFYDDGQGGLEDQEAVVTEGEDEEATDPVAAAMDEMTPFQGNF